MRDLEDAIFHTKTNSQVELELHLYVPTNIMNKSYGTLYKNDAAVDKWTQVSKIILASCIGTLLNWEQLFSERFPLSGCRTCTAESHEIANETADMDTDYISGGTCVRTAHVKNVD